jgi:hypothetical protein
VVVIQGGKPSVHILYCMHIADGGTATVCKRAPPNNGAWSSPKPKVTNRSFVSEGLDSVGAVRSMSQLPTVNTLWIGEHLGPIERACLRSFLRVGHPVQLFLYQKIAGIPAGVEVQDARDVLPEGAIVRHQSGSVALFSDYFRYKLQALGAGYWIDTDTYCLRALDFSNTMVLGWESETHCAVGVLRLETESQLLNALLSIFEERRLSTWFPWRDRIGFVLDKKQAMHFPLRKRISAATGRNFSRGNLLKHLPWGAAGPKAITHYVKLFGYASEVLPRDVFYPVHYREAGWISDPTKSLGTKITPNTHAIHLWNFLLSETKKQPPRPGSFLKRLYEEGA